MAADEPLLPWIHDAVRTLLRARGAVASADTDAAALCARLQGRFGPGRYYVPAADTALRNGALLQDHVVHRLDVPALAAKYGLTPNMVRKILMQAGVPRRPPAPPSPDTLAPVPSDDPFL